MGHCRRCKGSPRPRIDPDNHGHGLASTGPQTGMWCEPPNHPTTHPRHPPTHPRACRIRASTFVDMHSHALIGADRRRWVWVYLY